MNETRTQIFNEDHKIHSIYDRKVSLNLAINSKGEIITAHKYNIQFYSSNFRLTYFVSSFFSAS